MTRSGRGSTPGPSLSTSVALVLGVASLLAIVAFIDHNAHLMDVSEILEDITTGNSDRVETTWPDASAHGGRDGGVGTAPPGPGRRIDATADG